MNKTLTIIVSLLLFGHSAFAQGGGTVLDGMRAVSDHYGVYFAYNSGLPLDAPFGGQSFKGKSLKKSLAVLFAETDGHEAAAACRNPDGHDQGRINNWPD